MEHLTYYPPADVRDLESDAVAEMNVLEIADWEAWDQSFGPCGHSFPTFEWLGWPHDDADDGVPCQEFDDYARKQNWPGRSRWERFVEDPSSFQAAAKKANRSYEDFTTNVVAFAQSWLYASTLEVCLRKRVKLSFITRTTSQGIMVLYSRAIPYALWKRRSVLSKMQPSTKEAALESIGKCVNDATSLIITLAQISARLSYLEGPGSFLETLILAAIRPLSQLQELINHAFFPGRLTLTPKVLVSASSERLTARGWCPALLSWIGEDLGQVCPDWLDATSKVSKNNHSTCDQVRCLHSNINEEDYHTLHCSTGCKCGFVRPNFQEIEDALTNGALPLIRLSDDGAEIDTYYQTAYRTREYIAFSHVWSNGLGSSAENGLPVCQLRRLARLSREASESDKIHFWIDSLCVPKKPPLRKIAISMMKSTYREATKTVVLDDIASDFTLKKHWTHRAWAIISSPWMTRLWTFEEGLLSRDLLFQFKNGFVHASSLLCELRELRDLYPLAHIFHNVLFLLFDKSSEPEVELNLGKISPHLGTRTTSKPQDELLAISGLLGLDLGQLYELSGEERLRHFYLQIGNLPWDIVFDGRPKMKTRPFTWAPSTFLCRNPFGMNQNCSAICCESGLKVHMTVLHLEEVLNAMKTAVPYDPGGNTSDFPRYRMICLVKASNSNMSGVADKFGLFLNGDCHLPAAEFDAILVRTDVYRGRISSIYTKRHFTQAVAVKRVTGRDASSGLPVYTVSMGGDLCLTSYPSNAAYKSYDGKEVKGVWAQEEILLV